MAEWFKHKTVNFGNVGSIPTAPANIKLNNKFVTNLLTFCVKTRKIKPSWTNGSTLEKCRSLKTAWGFESLIFRS